MKLKILTAVLFLSASACNSTSNTDSSNSAAVATPTPANLATLGFIRQAVATNTDSVFSTQPIIAAYDASGAIITSNPNLSIALTAYDSEACAGNVIASALDGTTSMNLSGGAALFTNIKPLKTSIKSLMATSGSVSVCSDPISVSAGTPVGFVISSGNAQTATVGAAATNPLVALLKDAHDNGVPNTTITWAVTAGSGSLSSCTNTNANGLAQCSFTLGTVVGANSVTAAATGFPTLSFSATGTVGALSPAQSTFTISSASIVSGSTATLTLTLKDAYGNQIGDSTQASNLAFSMLATGASSGTIGAISAVSGNAGTYQATITGTAAGTANTRTATELGRGSQAKS